MKLIVGLGNPGRKYQNTRHNVGFTVVAEIARRTAAGQPKTKFEGEFAEVRLGQEKVGLLCPHTFMNASGTSVRQAHDFYKLEQNDILLLCDDLNLPTGRIRLRARGSAGGQKGIADVIRHLGSDEIPRLRIGIDRPPAGWAVPDYVLGKFAPGESAAIEDAIQDAASAVEVWVDEGITAAMNRFNAA